MARHPRYIAHQVSVPDYSGALAAIVNGVVNNPMAVYEMGPSAATLEFAVVNWMLEKVGFVPQPLPGDAAGRHGGGVLTHGGSLANLTSLLAARARVAPDAWESGTPHDLAVLVPRGSHYSVARAVSILGLGSRAIYPLEVDRHGVVDPAALAPALARLHDDGRRCMAVVANACATATGLHDPLRPIGEFCAEHELWFHADACHGATALLSDAERHHLDGIELADSIVWDAHKMMQVPVLCAAVLFRDGRDFGRAFQQQASYLAMEQTRDTYTTMPRAVECTKASLGLKVFLTVAWRGERGLGDYVAGRYAAARRFAERIAQRPGFSVPYAPQSNILCFRYGDDDALMEAIREHLLRSRRFHITSAELGGRRHLRLTVMNARTDEVTIDALLDALEETGAALRAGA